MLVYVIDAVLAVIVAAVAVTVAVVRELKQGQRRRRRWRLLKNEFIFRTRNSQLSWSVQYVDDSKNLLRQNMQWQCSIPKIKIRKISIVVVRVTQTMQNLAISRWFQLLFCWLNLLFGDVLVAVVAPRCCMWNYNHLGLNNTAQSGKKPKPSKFTNSRSCTREIYRKSICLLTLGLEGYAYTYSIKQKDYSHLYLVFLFLDPCSGIRILLDKSLNEGLFGLLKKKNIINREGLK